MQATAPRSGSDADARGACPRRRRDRSRGSRGRGRRWRPGCRSPPRRRASGSGRSPGRPARAGPQPRARPTSPGTTVTLEASSAGHVAGHPARVAADPSPWSRQALRPAREDCRVSSRSTAHPTGVGLQSDTCRPRTTRSTTGVRPKSDTGAASRSRILETSPFPILLVCLVGIVLLSVFAPSIVVGDTWLTLMAGREVVEHGLPHTEHLTVLGEGRTWTDQQWLAQVVFYAAHELAGMRAVILLGIALVLLALGARHSRPRGRAARRRARPSSIGLLAVLAGPWGWTFRAQTTALPLFAGRAVAPRRRRRAAASAGAPCSSCRSSSSGRTSTAPSSSAPALAMLLGVVELVRARRLAWIPLALVVLSPLCVLASPYGREARRLLRPDARRRAVRADPARVAVVEPERDDRALLAARARRRAACSRCAAAGPA